ncbi:MAG: response regulator [Eubacteriales bacterium]|nr:response regulator [Eubacteriales bacterium]
MMKLLIADDEPLVQIGLKSMLDWASLDIEICGTAANGEQAYNLIVQEKPEIVISDIKMPVMSGLELAKRCREEFGRFPVFIILTSYEDFQFAREALSIQAVDYLIKLELTPESLGKAVRHAVQAVREGRKLEVPQTAEVPDLALFQERFYIRLLNGLFESRDQFLHQIQEFQIPFDAAGYRAASIRLRANGANPLTQEQKLTLNRSTLQMFSEMMTKYLPCHVISLDIQHFAVIFFIPREHLEDSKEYLFQALCQTFDMLFNYYTVSLFGGVGRLVSEPFHIADSYSEAKQFLPTDGKSGRIVFGETQAAVQENHNVFSLSLFREEIRKAFEETNEEALKEILDNIMELLSNNRVQLAQAMDAASSFLHLTINLLEDGAEIAARIFQDEADGYQGLYRLNSVGQVVSWLEKLKEGLIEALQDQQKKGSNYLVENVKRYVGSNLDKRLTLQDTALTFSISPSYLSQLFKKYAEVGFNEYVSQRKVEKAKEYLKQNQLKIYEIAEQLGFENAFYFSKVFKKFEGCSPRDYLNRG